MASRRRIMEALITDTPLSKVLGALIALGLDMRLHPSCAPYLEHTLAPGIPPSTSRVQQ